MVTTLLFRPFPKELVQSAKLLVKEDCILAGVELAEIIFKTFDKDLKVEVLLKMEKTQKLATLLSSLLEVRVLSFLQKD